MPSQRLKKMLEQTTSPRSHCLVWTHRTGNSLGFPLSAARIYKTLNDPKGQQVSKALPPSRHPRWPQHLGSVHGVRPPKARLTLETKCMEEMESSGFCFFSSFKLKSFTVCRLHVASTYVYLSISTVSTYHYHVVSFHGLVLMLFVSLWQFWFP